MAKKAKNFNLSIEERLEQALIANWDEPYKLPPNWCWTHWGNCGQFVAGGAFKEKYQGQKGLPIPFYKVGSLKYSDRSGYLYDETNTIDEEIKSELKTAIIPVNSIIFAKIGEAIRLNRRSLNEAPCCIDNNLMAFIPNDKCYYKYVYYWSKGVDLYEYANATTVPAVRKTDLESIPFPLAPYEAQIEIVERIESLFAKLDEAKEKAQGVVDGFETRKAAILHKAFSGELTAKWRTEHCVSQGIYEKTLLGELTEITSSKRIYKEEYVQTGIPFFRSSEVVELHDHGMTIPEYFISRQRYEEIKCQYGVPCEGDLLVTSVGTIGKTWIVDGREFYYKDGNLTQVKKCNALNMKYLQYFIKSENFKQQIKDTVAGSAYNALTIVKFKKILIPVAGIEEQIEIVNTLDSLLSKEQLVKEAAEAVIDKIDTMKKAILARAFRGELGTNDPTEESAIELLKQIL